MSAEDVASDIIEDLVGAQNLRVGQGNTRQLIHYRLNSELVSGHECDAGIQFAIEQGWLEPGSNNYIVLTAAGVDQANADY